MRDLSKVHFTGQLGSNTGCLGEEKAQKSNGKKQNSVTVSLLILIRLATPRIQIRKQWPHMQETRRKKYKGKPWKSPQQNKRKTETQKMSEDVKKLLLNFVFA